MPAADWKLGLLAREAILNVFGRGARMLPLVALAVLAGVASSSFAAVEAITLDRAVDQLAESGMGIVVYGALNPDEPVAIERSSCEGLADEPGIQRAGIVIDGVTTTLVPVGQDLPTMRASTTLFPLLSRADIVVGSAFRTAADGEFWVSQAGADHGTLAVVAPKEPDALGSNASVLLPLRPTDTTGPECVVVFEKFADTGRGASAYSAQLSTQGNAVAGVEALPNAVDPAIAYLERPGRFLPLLLGVMGAVAAGIFGRLRASEIAVYRLSGSSSSAVVSLMTMESIAVAGIALVSAVATAVALWPWYLDATVAMLGGLALAGTWTIGSILMTIDLAFRRPTDLAKDR